MCRLSARGTYQLPRQDNGGYILYVHLPTNVQSAASTLEIYVVATIYFASQV